MELRIGILHSPRELSFETNDSATEIQERIVSAEAVLRFEDDKGKIYLVNAQQLAYVEIGEETPRRVGFVA